mmetsp:Transcript_786/g.1341  ORF Transcript_786/g.1341 Transcript_786/m.1341 type:complete len:93 (+) Transcript_786:271-549(+)
MDGIDERKEVRDSLSVLFRALSNNFFCSLVSLRIIPFETFEKDADEDEETFSSQLGYFRSSGTRGGRTTSCLRNMTWLVVRHVSSEMYLEVV